jgi:putative PIN family toxin of toxin-antitoxin system
MIERQRRSVKPPECAHSIEMRNQRDPHLPGAVLDSSVIVSAFLSGTGASAEILRLWRQDKAFQVILSDPILAEVIRVLLEHSIADSIVEDFVAALHLLALMTDNLYVVRRVEQDPSDDVFLAAALEGQADYIVTLDRHLLSLKQYHGVQIVRPTQFLSRLRKRDRP